jgi:hypothetical protein
MATNRVSLAELERVLPRRDLSRLAVKHEVDAVNQVRLPGVAVFTCLLDTILNHGVVTQRLLAEIYEQRTGTRADHSSFSYRLSRIPASYFEALYDVVHGRLAPQASAAEQRRCASGGPTPRWSPSPPSCWIGGSSAGTVRSGEPSGRSRP